MSKFVEQINTTGGQEDIEEKKEIPNKESKPSTQTEDKNAGRRRSTCNQ